MPEKNSTKAYYHIAFAADSNFSVPLGLACLSLFQSAAKSNRYHVHILGIDVEEAVLDELRRLCDARGHLLTYHDVDAALRGVMKTDYFPSVAFGRFLLPDLLPDEVERVIYSDSDVMISRDLADLYELDMGNHLLGAVQELAPVWNKDFPENYSNWARCFNQSEDEALYCYSGFILFNLNACREEKLSAHILDCAASTANKLSYPDQDIMNGLCQGRFMSLPHRYVMIPHLYGLYTTRAAEVTAYPRMNATKEELHEAAKNPSIIHFASSSKPFVLMPPRCGYEQFYELWLSSPWKHRIPYLPHRMHQGVRVCNSLIMKLVLLNMVVATYIPFYYPLWWKLSACLPESILHRIARFFNWTYPNH